MKRPPRDINEGIFSGGTLKAVLTRGLLIGAAVIVSHYIGLQVSGDGNRHGVYYTNFGADTSNLCCSFQHADSIGCRIL